MLHTDPKMPRRERERVRERELERESQLLERERGGGGNQILDWAKILLPGRPGGLAAPPDRDPENYKNVIFALTLIRLRVL